jgi:hypothetical protein
MALDMDAAWLKLGLMVMVNSITPCSHKRADEDLGRVREMYMAQCNCSRAQVLALGDILLLQGALEIGSYLNDGSKI